jgi:hypothetical protein
MAEIINMDHEAINQRRRPFPYITINKGFNGVYFTHSTLELLEASAGGDLIHFTILAGRLYVFKNNNDEKGFKLHRNRSRGQNDGIMLHNRSLIDFLATRFSRVRAGVSFNVKKTNAELGGNRLFEVLVTNVFNPRPTR